MAASRHLLDPERTDWPVPDANPPREPAGPASRWGRTALEKGAPESPGSRYKPGAARRHSR